MRSPAFVLFALLLAGCTLDTDYFREYRGTNLLGNWDFDTGQWALDVGTEFMTWEPVSGESHEGHLAYRLEIKNLVSNGDFEDEAITPDAGALTVVPTNWTLTGGTVAFGPTHGTGSETVGITGRSMRWTANSGGNALGLDLGAALGVAWQPSTSYRVRFDFADLGESGGVIEVNLVKTYPDPLGNPLVALEGGDWKQSQLTRLTKYSLSEQFIQPSILEDRSLVWGPLDGAGATDVVLDNLRVFLDAGSRSVATALPSLDSGTLTLLPGSKAGMYQLTVWVKDDPTAGDNNRFAASAVSIKVEGAVKSGTGSPSPRVFERPDGGWTDWTALTMDFGFDFVSDDDDLGAQPALSINITPMKLGETVEQADVGSVLVAHPTLTFNP